MPKCDCLTCGNSFQWQWEEAFDKFGFNDGDGQVETYQVENVLTDAGYDVQTQTWGMHNTLIVSVKKDGLELISSDDPNVDIGYSDPRSYLPKTIIQLLDRELA